jgi:hypothetical protein
MRYREFITEGVGDNYLYHSVASGATMMQILKSGYILPQEPFDFDRDQDIKSSGKALDRISLTRNQFLHFPYGHGVAQLVIDKNALRKSGFKIVPKTGAGMNYKNETEEQVFKPIPVKLPFVIAIQYDPRVKIPKNILNQTKNLGIRLEPWRQTTKTKDNETETGPLDPKINPNKLFIQPLAPYEINGEILPDCLTPIGSHGNEKEKFGKERTPTKWQIIYKDSENTETEISPKYNNKKTADSILTKILDRISQGKGFDDVLGRQYRKTWTQGRQEIPPKNTPL